MNRIQDIMALICLLFLKLPKFEMASGKVLEETYRKWVQYKDDCVKMIENEPLLQGKGIWQNVGKEEKETGVVRRRCSVDGHWEIEDSGQVWRDKTQCEEEKEVTSQEDTMLERHWGREIMKQTDVREMLSHHAAIGCRVAQVIMQYCVLANHYWFFGEAIYLYSVLIASVFIDNKKYLPYICLGWVPERHRSSATTSRAMPDGSPTPESSFIFRRQDQPTSPQLGESLLQCPSVVKRDNNLQHGEQDDNGQSAVAMQNKTLKCTVFQIRGPVPANSYIMIPKNSNQSLGLTGRYFYLLFRPTPGRYFVVHLDVSAEEGQVVRLSFSNMFKEFKSTPTSLQFPFLCGAAKDSVYESTAKSARHGFVGPAPTSVRWTCLMLDLQYTLSVYVNRCYSHLKSIKLCANMSVKNMFTSDLLLDPGVSFSEAKLMGLTSSQGTGPMPRDMSFPVPKGGSWHDLYDYIRFPSEGTKLPFDSIQKGNPKPEATCVSNQRRPVREEPCCVNLSKPVQDRVSLIQQITTPKSLQRNRTPLVTNIPELGVVSTHQKDDWLRSNNDQHQQESSRSNSHHLRSRPPV
ncbi:WD repeat-containing protein 90 [Larimichthys crocea]|uniref:Uncharacterized protein n=1 Tax=Larimichthys crocea TaxID=215358 RepID=A0ACD3RUC0_LARCR|nr:WD repeat-containing protein 90 [Larimichthys crocea]